MTHDIKGLEQWEGETREWNRKAGKLKTKAGIGLVNSLERWYGEWKTKRTDRNTRETLTWRLRLHLRHNDDPDFLMELDEYFDLGLTNEEVGPTYWEIPPDTNVRHRKGYNWRTDSGYAIRGGSTQINREEDETNPDDKFTLN